MTSLNPVPSRRRFLQTASGAPVVALASAGMPALASSSLSSTLRRSDFEPCVGQFFVFEAPGGSQRVRARLQQVQAMAGGDLQSDLCFSLLFKSEEAAVLSQGTWRFSSAQGPSGLMFLSPNDSQGLVVEAVFNRA